MSEAKPTVVVTGISGNLGLRLLPLLADFSVIGIDMAPPKTDAPLRFLRLDLGVEDSTRVLYNLFKEARPFSVVHLAFILDAVRSGVLEVDRMWQINVAGTARVMEAITEANRNEDSGIRQFIFPSSVAAYGSDLPGPVAEDYALEAHTLPYAIHKKESDEVVQQRAPALRGCSAYILRPHIFAGASVENYMLGAFRGTPNGKGKRAAQMRKEGKRLPCLLPYGQKYLDHKIQFVHVDDMARLIAWLLQREPEARRLTVMNVAGRGEPLTFGRCINAAHAKLVRVPGKWAMRSALQFLWKRGVSAIPPEAVPYMTGQYIMSTERLKKFLGDDYEKVIRYTIADAFLDSFKTPTPVSAAQHTAAT
ncbi:MAG TPA: NAD-dependent epimerase/dehydratase family protein [Terriglobales bacterium]|nr:NAD-dependent epimerase/dehydratase family protein [Terriglobales bacterium]